MTTIAVGRLSETLQNLVDARLDTIDRMLLGRVNRQDRLAIVREVESQIFDLIQGRDAEALDRDDILAVLARLDPPEAYLTEETNGERGTVRVELPSRAIRPAAETQPWKGMPSGILGIIAMGLVFLTLVLVFRGSFVSSTSELVFFGLVGWIFTHGLLAVILAARARLADAWAIVGLVTGIIAVILSLLGTIEIFL